MAETADFVIVGGGTSGLRLANRLAFSPSKPSLILLEARSDNSGDINYRDPSKRWSLPFINPELDYGYATTPTARSEGSVTLASNRTEDPPLISPKTFEHPFDRKAIVESVKHMLQMFKGTDVYKDYFLGWAEGLPWTIMMLI